MDCPPPGLAIDAGRVAFPGDFVASPATALDRALDERDAIERGDQVNTSEQRCVGHCWLRKPEWLRVVTDLEFHPSADGIPETLDHVRKPAARVRAVELAGACGPFAQFLVIEVGGFAVGPRFVARALGHPATDRLRLGCFANTDPDGRP